MTWDLILVTARTAPQRWLFERYLDRLWPSCAPRWRVLQDPPGPQLGTAGASIRALSEAERLLGDRLSMARVLILHCGGLSQRAPQLSHIGKAFAPGPDREREGTLFAQVVAELARLFVGSEAGIVLACGDVLYQAPDLRLACRRDETVAVAYGSSPDQASRHGVYLWGAGQDRVHEAWQKPAVERLLSLAADQPWGMDTGILFLGAEVAARLLRAIRRPGAAARRGCLPGGNREWRGLDLYRDLAPAMTASWQDGRRLPGVPGAVQRVLAGFPLRVVCPCPAELLHFGTTQELLRILGSGGPPRLHASSIAGGELGVGVVLDRCLLERALCVGAGSYVSGLNRPGGELRIASGRIAYQLPVRPGGARPRGDVCVALGVSDDARRHPTEGAELLGQPLADWLRLLGASPAEVWDGVPEGERCLWNARLFPLAPAEEVAGAVPWLPDNGEPAGETVDRWRRWPRISMAEAQRGFDARRWWAHEERIRAHRFAAEIEAAVRQGEGALVGRFLENPRLSRTARALARQRLRQLGKAEAASLTGARAWLVASHFSLPGAAGKLRERAFRSLSGVLLAEPAGGPALQWQVRPGEAIEARAPVRVDLVGGWTDTPPQACERGGTVLNLALLLDGRRPLVARVERLAEPVVELVARDQDARLTLHTAPPARRRPDPGDPLALHLAALRLIGLLVSPLEERLRRLGGGLRVTTEAGVPKGSGLGTSSLLGAALLAALHRALGREVSRDELCLQVLQLEQMMGTGGGWQDQVGGMWGGIKLAFSAPGLDQHPQVEHATLTPEREAELHERMVLFYTGEPRLAKDVLQRVVGSYLAGAPATLAALDEMPALTQRAHAALAHGDWEALGRCLNRSWALNRQIEPTSTNESLDALFARIAPFVLGAKLAGAGGGGFLFALARDRAAREGLEHLLAEVAPPARLFQATLDREGLVVLPG